jgi:hypothetical protein
MDLPMVDGTEHQQVGQLRLTAQLPFLNVVYLAPGKCIINNISVAGPQGCGNEVDAFGG